MADIPDEDTGFSFEVFPPKTDTGMRSLCGENGVLEKLYTLQPRGISCSYGAGGSNLGKNLEVLDKIVKDARTQGITHFTSAGNTEVGIHRQLETYLHHGVRHILTLPENAAYQETDADAARLVKLVRRSFGRQFVLSISVAPLSFLAGYAEIEALRAQQDSGADIIRTQLCWDLDQFRRWLDAIRGAGIWLPVEVGIMPVLDIATTIETTLRHKGCVMPQALSELISQNWIYPNPFVKDPFDAEVEGKRDSFKAAGLDYTIRQIHEYRACDIHGIHLYTGNQYEDIARIVTAAK